MFENFKNITIRKPILNMQGIKNTTSTYITATKHNLINPPGKWHPENTS